MRLKLSKKMMNKLFCIYLSVVLTMSISGFSYGFIYGYSQLKYLMSIYSDEDLQRRKFHNNKLALLHYIVSKICRYQNLKLIYKIDHCLHHGFRTGGKTLTKSALFPFMIISALIKKPRLLPSV